MSASVRASIVVIGDEILGGFVQDTNSGWLAQRLQTHGVPLDRVATVPDEVGAITEALHTELARARPRLVLTSGGLGSTPDDLTYEAVAHALDLDLVTDPVLEARVDAILERAHATGMHIPAEHRDSLHKMSRVPDGSYLLAGSSLAPGVAVDVDGGLDQAGATIVVLPGIPSELRRITAEGIEPVLLAGRGKPDHVVELRHPYPESVLNPTLERLVRDMPEVHTGSYPGRECIVRLKGPKERVESAAAMVEEALAALAQQDGADRLAASWQAYWPEAEG